MRYTGLLLAILIMTSVAAPAAAQGLDAGGVEDSLSPLVALIEGVTRIGWTLTQLFVGMDDASIAYFTYELGFREDEVTMNVNDTYTNDPQTCLIGSFRINDDDDLVCKSTDGDDVAVGKSDNVNVTLSDVEDYNEDGVKDLPEAFRYLDRNNYGDLKVSDGAKGQVMLFALIIPLGIMGFLLEDFFASTGMLRGVTVHVVSFGIALIAARSGVYTALLTMISSIFGAGGFFLSMLSIYLILAIIMWFYGGVLRSKAIAESQDVVAEAVVSGFAADMQRGLLARDVAEQRANKKKE